MSATDTMDATDRSAMEGLALAMENAIDYIGSATATAGASMKSAAGRTGGMIGAGAYKGAYGVSYGVVFAGVFLKEMLPAGNAVRRGFEDGAQAAFDRIEQRKADVEPLASVEETIIDEPEAPRASRRKSVPASEI